MDTPATDQDSSSTTDNIPEATSDDLGKIFGSVQIPTLSEDDIGGTDTVDPTLPIPEPPPAVTAPETPAVSADVVGQAEALARKANHLAQVADPAPPTRSRAELKARTDLGVNWSAAFLLFAKGFPLKQISIEFDIPYTRLVERAFKEDWELLVKKHSGSLVAAPVKPENVQLAQVDTERRMKRVLSNRERNYEAAESLRDNIVKVIQAYQLDNQFLRPDDIATLAKALKTTAEISMLVLGDEFVMGKDGNSGKGGAGNSMRPIIINLPSAVSGGKDQRRVEQLNEEDQPAPGKEVDADAVIELTVLGKTQGDREAKPAPSGRGCGINFQALPNIKTPAK